MNGRSSTRPHFIHPSGADATVSFIEHSFAEKLDVFAQSHREECISRIRSIIASMLNAMGRFGSLVFGAISAETSRSLFQEISSLETVFASDWRASESQKSRHGELLKPALGDPVHFDTLKSLHSAEEQRFEEAVTRSSSYRLRVMVIALYCYVIIMHVVYLFFLQDVCFYILVFFFTTYFVNISLLCIEYVIRGMGLFFLCSSF